MMETLVGMLAGSIGAMRLDRMPGRIAASDASGGLGWPAVR